MSHSFHLPVVLILNQWFGRYHSSPFSGWVASSSDFMVNFFHSFVWKIFYWIFCSPLIFLIMRKFSNLINKRNATSIVNEFWPRNLHYRPRWFTRIHRIKCVCSSFWNGVYPYSIPIKIFTIFRNRVLSLPGLNISPKRDMYGLNQSWLKTFSTRVSFG